MEDEIIKENRITVNYFLALSIEIFKGRSLVKGSNPIIDLIIIKKCEFYQQIEYISRSDSIKNNCQITVNTPEKGAGRSSLCAKDF